MSEMTNLIDEYKAKADYWQARTQQAERLVAAMLVQRRPTNGSLTIPHKVLTEAAEQYQVSIKPQAKSLKLTIKAKPEEEA